MRFKNKIIVVSGGGIDKNSNIFGFGFQIAKDLFLNGARVVILGRNIDRLKEASNNVAKVKNLNKRFFYYKCDIANESEVLKVFQKIEKNIGSIYGLVNNAAINIRKPLLDISVSDIRHVLDVNIMGSIVCSKFALEQMIKTGEGSIVHISSIAAKKIPLSEMPAYNISKRAIEALSDSIVKDYGGRGIISNVIRPGYARTPLTDKFFNNNPERLKVLEKKQPLGGLVTLKQVSDMALGFLDIDCQKSGQIIEVSNGYV